MIDFNSALIYFDCARCNGNASQFPGGFCEDCCNSGEWPFYLGTLFDNLAIAGGLCAAFAHGCNAEWNWSQLSDEVQWTPNTEGRTAPGWRES